MKTFVKNIISSALCAVLLATAPFCANAVSADDNFSTGSSFNDFNNSYRIVGRDIIPEKHARMYTYGALNTGGYKIGIKFEDSEYNYDKTVYFDVKKSYVQTEFPNYSCKVFKYVEKNTGGSWGSAPSLRMLNKNEEYRKIRVKLGEYSDYFNSDGTHTENGHKYNFKAQENGYFSMLTIHSGAAITAVTPDKNGFVEFYSSKRIGAYVYFSTEIFTGNTSGGVVRQEIKDFTVGDADTDGKVTVTDATIIQKYLVDLAEFNDAVTVNADVNDDGVVDIKDATMIQSAISV